MYNFLVLGLVPGTNIQITFKAWLYALTLGLLAYLLVSYRHQTIEQVSLRQPLPASRLHNRR